MIIRDITERKHMEIGLQKSEEFQRAVIACSPVALYSIDLDGNVMTWNASAERVLGWKAGEVIGRPLPIVPEDKQAEFASLRQRILQGESFTGLELTRQKKGEVLFDASLSAAPIYDTNRQVIGIMGALEDITVRKQSDIKIMKQLEELQRWNAISLEREGRILELKREINLLLTEIGHSPRYSSAELGTDE